MYDLIVGTTSYLMAEGGDIIKLIFSNEKASSKNIRLSEKDFNTTFLNIPFYWVNNKNNLPQKFNLLDSETLSVIEMDSNFIGLEKTGTTSESVLSHRYEIISSAGVNYNIWLAISQHNLPYLVKIDGEDQDGKFQVILKNIVGTSD